MPEWLAWIIIVAFVSLLITVSSDEALSSNREFFTLWGMTAVSGAMTLCFFWAIVTVAGC